MNIVINALAVLGSVFIFANLFNVLPNDILQYIGFFIWGIMNTINAKIHRDKGEKSKARIIIICALTLFCVSVWGILSFRPFESMNVNEIEEIKVYAIHPDKEVVLNEAELESAVPLLQNLKISKPGYMLFPPMGWGGQTVRFTVQKTDGSTIVISNFGNVLITIDSINYQADYESAHAISIFANKVLETGFYFDQFQFVDQRYPLFLSNGIG